jgi:uncharacterized protein (DUF2336 family)
MIPVLRLMQDLERAIAIGSTGRNEATLRRVTDLFLLDAPLFTDEQIRIFEGVIGRLVAAAGTRARAELALRLAEAAHAPPGVIRALAHDEIAVAHPILVHSPRLADEDLIAVAAARGRDHLRAIARRKALAEPVTDLLVARGDGPAMRAMAANTGARLSAEGAAALVDRARFDDDLRQWLARRTDLPLQVQVLHDHVLHDHVRHDHVLQVRMRPLPHPAPVR